MTTTRRRRPRIVQMLRVVALFVITFVVGANTVAWLSPCSVHVASTSEAAEPCCPSERQRHADDAAVSTEAPSARVDTIQAATDHDTDSPCSCPVKCGTGCAGAPAAAVSMSPSAVPPLLLTDLVLTFVVAPGRPARGQGFDVLHVPIG